MAGYRTKGTHWEDADIQSHRAPPEIRRLQKEIEALTRKVTGGLAWGAARALAYAEIKRRQKDLNKLLAARELDKSRRRKAPEATL